MFFNEEKYELECQVCMSLVMNQSKHCRDCNRCVPEFDHHCYWINNDIGLINYAGFLRMIIAAALTITI